MFAKKYNGTFILRIEDTDQNRYVENEEKYIVDALNWCNIPFDEGVNKNEKFGQIGRAHVWTPVTDVSRMPSSAWKKKQKKKQKKKKTKKKKTKKKNNISKPTQLS